MFVSAINNNQLYNFQINRNCSAKISNTNNTTKVNYMRYSYPALGISFKSHLPQSQPTVQERFEGCILGGAIGDAMGYPIEGFKIKDIQNKFGSTGLHFPIKLKGCYHFSDDTQMSLFTIKGLLNSFKYNKSLDKEPNYQIMYNAYEDWYKTQVAIDFDENTNDMFSRQELYSRRGPGRTCLTSLKNKLIGTVEEPINNSPTNGAVMRVAPIGLLYSHSPELAFEIGVKSAAMTHGNEGAYLPAGFLSCLIANITQGNNLEESIEIAEDILKKQPKHKYLLSLINEAKELAKTDMESIYAIESIGKGYRGDEALAISLYSALKHPHNFKNAVVTSINHSGDSDTTGAITGNIMGALLGTRSIHRSWKENIELSDLLYKCSEELYKVNESGKNYVNMLERRNQDVFSAKITKLQYTDDELAQMELMTPEEKEQFIWKKKITCKY